MEEEKKTEEKKDEYRTGIFRANEKGFGFIETDVEDEDDFFVPEKYTFHAFHGDTVKFRVLPDQRGERAEARITEIVEHAVKQVVGTYEKSEGYGFIVCDSRKIHYDIYIRRENSMQARDGQKVVADIISYGTERMSPEGKIVEILGDKDAPGVDILSIVRSYEIPEAFPEDVLDQTESFPEDISESEYSRRVDLRDVNTCTIDGDDSKDFDDAVSIQKDGSDYILAVHIADVSNYVTEGSPLDKEALARGTSVYLCDRVIPMLPYRLSDDLCSIVEGKDRLALTCIMHFNHAGEKTEYRICESVIRSNHRMTYNNVNRILEDKDPDTCAKYADMLPDFRLMEELAKKLFKRRIARGSIEFDIPEADIILDENGHAVDVRLATRGTSQKMIEEFMLAANETVALDFCRQKIPFVYRVHDIPDEERIKKLKTLIEKFGYIIHAKNDEVKPSDISALLAKIEGKDEEDFISTIALRSMQRAVYSTENRGHFGLASKYYCHFTSPIRRYPDLQIHRIIKESLQGKYTKKRKDHYIGILDGVADHSSDMERRATECERDVDKLKKTEYMCDHVGESFEGKVSGVVKWGLYVELPNTVEGLISVRTMSDDHYVYDEDAMELVGETKNRHFTFGTPVRVKLVSADLVNRTLDFVLDEPGMDEEAAKRRTSGGHRSPGKEGRSGKEGKKIDRSSDGAAASAFSGGFSHGKKHGGNSKNGHGFRGKHGNRRGGKR